VIGSPGTRRLLPDPDQALLLRAALGRGDQARSAWRSWVAGGGDVQALDEPAHRLLPQLYRNLEALGVDDPELGRLKGVYRHSWYRNQRLLHRAAGAIAALRGAGIETVLLKGAALTAVYQQDLGARPMNDVDVLLRPEQVPEAVEVLDNLGWRLVEDRPMGDRPVAYLMRTTHSHAVRAADGNELDLHWSPVWEPGPDEGIWQDARPVEVAGTETLVPSATDQLVIACVHGVLWIPSPLRWIADAAVVLSVAGDEVDWDLLERRARERHVELAMADTLSVVRDVLELPVPAGTLDRLRSAPASPVERFLHALKLAPPRRGMLYLSAWERSRRLARVTPGPFGYPAGTVAYIAEMFGLPNRRALVPAMLRKAVQIARYGDSEAFARPTSGAEIARARNGAGR
jgi:hypothetical protein